MALPLKIDGTSGLIEISDTDLNYIADLILKNFADNVGTGSIFTGTTNAQRNLVGSFTDNIRNDAIGVHPTLGATSTVTTTIVQTNTAVNETSMIRPLEINGTEGIIESVNASLDATIIARCLSRLANDGIGSYTLSTSSSLTNYTQRFSFTDTLKGGTTNTYYVHQRTNNPTGTLASPIKIDGSVGVAEMSIADIQTLTNRLRNRIIATGIGTYKLVKGSTAPTGGTWKNVGATSDRLRNIGNVSYTRFFAGRPGGNFTGQTVLSTISSTGYILWRKTL